MLSMARRRGLACAVSAAVLLCALSTAHAAEDAGAAYRFPRAIVPYVGDHPPKIDGVLEKGEYNAFAAITGMVTWGGGGGGQTLVPEMQQVVWYVGYDDKYLYIAMHSPNPPGVWPLARTKQNDNGSILWDDHTEIQIAKSRSRATFPGAGFYKIMANGRSFFTDEWFYNGTPGTEGEWSIGAPLKSSVTKEHWDLEIAVDIRAFDEKKLEGQTWVLQLLRADKPGGTYFAGWAGEAWMSWEKFGEVTFDRTAPVFRFLKTGELAKGKMKLGFEVAGNAEAPVPVTVRVTVTDGNGKEIFNDTDLVPAEKDLTTGFTFESDLALTDRGNTIEILATYPGANDEPRVLYHVQAPINHHNDAYWAQHIAPWLAQRPKGDLAWAFAYWPSYGVAKTSVDTNFFGIKDQLGGASAFQVYVTPRAKEPTNVPVLAEGRVRIENKRADMILKKLDLPEGDYRATLNVFGADGKTVVDTRSVDFVRRHYEWEGNTLGEEDKVLPPFEPIKVEGNTLKVWGREYTVGADCLPSKIVAAGGAGAEDILTAPIRLRATSGGKELDTRLGRIGVDAGPARVRLSAGGKTQNPLYAADASLEFDGWYQVKLTVPPAQGDAAVDRLSLHVPLWKDADTLYVQRAGDGRRGNYFGALPKGEGLVWDSSRLLPFGQWGSFAPIVFVGTGDKGLWFLAEQNRDWTMSDELPAVQIFRTKAGVELRINIFADKTVLDRAREIEFAFLIDPVKQIPEERKWAWGRNVYWHNTYGYRLWGQSVDGFEQTDEDLRELNRVITDPAWKCPDDVMAGADRNHVMAFRNRYHKPVGLEGKMLTLYGSTSLTGLGLPAFDTYGGEWLRRTNWSPSPQTEYKGRHNIQCTKTWQTPRELTTVGVNFTPSYEDCFVWHHHRLIKNVPVNGTWWDNGSITVIEDYDPKREEFYRRFNVFQRRRLTKRLATMGYELGRRPWWINNMHVDWSFCQVSWHIENDFYVDNADMTQMDQLSVDEFRAMCRIKRGIIHRLASRGPEGNTEQVRRMGRSMAGMCLLHDIGSYNWGPDRWFTPGMLKVLDETVGFFDGAEFLPYWRNSHLVKIETPGVYASLYRGKGKVVVVVVNENREDADVRFSIGPEILGKKRPEKIYDGETGFAFGKRYDYSVRRTFWGELKPHIFGMPGGGVRMLVVE